jgi:hypothetical protein
MLLPIGKLRKRSEAKLVSTDLALADAAHPELLRREDELPGVPGLG